ncbi:hypothetical protein JCGZ_26621 [Jatropha curcas]|uniref:Uncharacterized protein n=1 Tax=Jatropha curcas TaxID=180498 RepID=A0A067JNK6_JATCU|nr:hypothetical protein JCGZ_26621 [Jatropha curcas]
MLETHLVSPYRMSPFGCTHVSIDNYNEVCQLYEAVCLKLVVASLSDEHIFMKSSLKNFPKLIISPPFSIDRFLEPVFEALFHSLSREDWDLLKPFKLKRLSYY